MNDLIDDTLSYLKGLKKRYLFGETEQVLPQEKPIVLAALPKPQFQPAPEPKQLEIALPEKPTKKTKVELAPISEAPQHVPIQSSLLEKIGLTPLDVPKDDSLAKRVRFGYKDRKHVPAIPILLSGSPYKLFLENVAKAISSKYGSSRVLNCDALESKKKWSVLQDAEGVELYIVPDFVLAQYRSLQEAFLENGSQRFLFGKPLLLLPDLSLYMKDPDLKRSLWNILCTMLEK